MSKLYYYTTSANSLDGNILRAQETDMSHYPNINELLTVGIYLFAPNIALLSICNHNLLSKTKRVSIASRSPFFNDRLRRPEARDVCRLVQTAESHSRREFGKRVVSVRATG